MTERDLIGYFAYDRLNLTPNIINPILEAVRAAIPYWYELINKSFLSAALKARYIELLENRTKRLNLGSL